MENLRISLDFYDNHQERLFENYSTINTIRDLTKNNLSINKSEFLTYLLFTEQKDRRAFRSYSDFSEKISKSYELIYQYLNFDNNSIKANFVGTEMNKDLIERVGVSISLCIMNKIHNLHEADWKKIPELNSSPTFDFEIASDGEKFIQAECKGSSINNNRLKISNISNHKANIERKKKRIRDDNNLFYGTIAVLDEREDTTAKCWLVDPPSFEIEIGPEKYRLLSRLYFYWTSLRYTTPNSTILNILINRIKEIKILENYKCLNGIYLLNRNGDKIKIHHNSFAKKSVIGDNNIIGKVYPLNQTGLFFMGFPQEIYNILISQDFNQILKFKNSSKIEKKEVFCRINKSDLNNYNIPPNIMNIKKEYETYIEFYLTGEMNFTKSGRVFGILNFEWQNDPLNYISGRAPHLQTPT